MRKNLKIFWASAWICIVLTANICVRRHLNSDTKGLPPHGLTRSRGVFKSQVPLSR